MTCEEGGVRELRGMFSYSCYNSTNFSAMLFLLLCGSHYVSVLTTYSSPLSGFVVERDKRKY